MMKPLVCLLGLAIATGSGTMARSLTCLSTVSREHSAASLPAIVAQQSRTQRIQFAPGKTTATIETAVIRGTRDIYLLGARQGQRMSITLSSLEKNAVFDLLTPANPAGQRRPLKQGGVFWHGRLPQTGDYQLVVGSTRGNAAYRLQITIR